LTLTPHIIRVLDLNEADLRPFRLGRDVGVTVPMVPGTLAAPRDREENPEAPGEFAAPAGQTAPPMTTEPPATPTTAPAVPAFPQPLQGPMPGVPIPIAPPPPPKKGGGGTVGS
jgi:hypothetical protein